MLLTCSSICLFFWAWERELSSFTNAKTNLFDFNNGRALVMYGRGSNLHAVEFFNLTFLDKFFVHFKLLYLLYSERVFEFVLFSNPAMCFVFHVLPCILLE